MATGRGSRRKLTLESLFLAILVGLDVLLEKVNGFAAVSWGGLGQFMVSEPQIITVEWEMGGVLITEF